jgi:nucleoside-diphosphate-sugar epimerase
MNIHTILGAGGAIGKPLANNLLSKNKKVRLVSRSGYSFQNAESFKADITNLNEITEATKNSDVVYICAGLQYDHKIWAVQWPKIITNAIEACKLNKCKLIFFDNVYMYGKVEGKMTEETPYNPVSKKGEIRAGISRMLEAEFKKGDVDVTIARSADFYGPYSSKSSMLYILAIDNMMKGKKAKWLSNADVTHSFSYTLDCAKALVLLSEDNDSFNQIWHLPTYNPAPTGKEFIKLISDELGVMPEYSVLNKWMVLLGGLFDKTIREIYEMLYQNEFEYYFDSTKFENYFKFKPIGYKEGIKETIAFIKSQANK